MLNIIVIVLLVIQTVGSNSNDLSESVNERALRAAFIQRILTQDSKFEGRVKLVGGHNEFEGNVYIYHAGRWGAVCDNGWDDVEANVVCQIYNMTGKAIRGGEYGDATEHFWIDNVECKGYEKSLSQCHFSGWGYSNCELYEAAGVVCGNHTEPTIPLKKGRKGKRESKPIYAAVDLTNATIRLLGGRNKFEGRVEVFIHGFWGSICPLGWSLHEAGSVCRHLSLGYAEEAPKTNRFGKSRIILSGVRCDGNEENLFLCDHEDYGDVKCPGEPGFMAAVVCTHFLADLSLDPQALERSAHIQDMIMLQLQCPMEENCMAQSAFEVQSLNMNWQFEKRRLLRFTVSVSNGGTADFRPVIPKHLWQWHLCHMHYHSMEDFATYDVLDEKGEVKVTEGHKLSFCLEDSFCMPGLIRKYSCKNYRDQGLSENCTHIYSNFLDCQWMDVTDMVTGDYKLKVAINPFAVIPEQTYFNNAVYCELRLTETYAIVYKCILDKF